MLPLVPTFRGLTVIVAGVVALFPRRDFGDVGKIRGRFARG